MAFKKFDNINSLLESINSMKQIVPVIFLGYNSFTKLATITLFEFSLKKYFDTDDSLYINDKIYGKRILYDETYYCKSCKFSEIWFEIGYGFSMFLEKNAQKIYIKEAKANKILSEERLKLLRLIIYIYGF